MSTFFDELILKTLDPETGLFANSAANATGDGGSIRISSNSDINASAVRGNGGNIQIETFGIFGIDRRETNTLNSDITASSEFGVDGLVDIVVREVTPDREKIALPEETIDLSKLVSQNLCAIDRENHFIVTKRSGLPDSPDRGSIILTAKPPTSSIPIPWLNGSGCTWEN
jgi:large exoprotein involved in heme utilization and adhesion